MRLFTEWYQAGIIPRSAFMEIAKQNDIIPNDYDDAIGVGEIEQDVLIVPVREQFDTEQESLAEERKAKADLAEAKARGVTQGGAKSKPTRERTKSYNDGSGSPER